MNLNKISLAITAAFVIFASSSCIRIVTTSDNGNYNDSSIVEASGDTISKTFAIGNFDKIDVATGIKIKFTQDENPGSARAVIYESLADRLVVETKGSTLNVHFKSNTQINSIKGNAVTLYVTNPTLAGIEVSSAGYIEIDNLKVDNSLEIDVSSAGKVSIANLICKDLNVESSSASKVNIEKVVCTNIVADASSASNITIEGIDCIIIDADASSASKITLEGTCQRFEEDYSSAGKINHKLLKYSN